VAIRAGICVGGYTGTLFFFVFFWFTFVFTFPRYTCVFTSWGTDTLASRLVFGRKIAFRSALASGCARG